MEESEEENRKKTLMESTNRHFDGTCKMYNEILESEGSEYRMYFIKESIFEKICNDYIVELNSHLS